jgi:hypothetical protein
VTAARRAEVALGALAIACSVLHTGNHLAHGDHWSNALWACNVATILVGVGLLAPSPRANAIGLLWLSVGLPLWLIDLAFGSPFLATSSLIHLPPLAIGAFGARRLGVPRGVVWQAFAALAALQLVCRLVTPPAENVNMVFAMEPSWQRFFPSYLWNYLAGCLLHAGAFAFLAPLYRKLHRIDTEPRPT